MQVAGLDPARTGDGRRNEPALHRRSRKEKGKPTCQTGEVLTVLATLGVALDLSPPTTITVEPTGGMDKGPTDATDT